MSKGSIATFDALTPYKYIDFVSDESTADSGAHMKLKYNGILRSRKRSNQSYLSRFQI